MNYPFVRNAITKADFQIIKYKVNSITALSETIKTHAKILSKYGTTCNSEKTEEDEIKRGKRRKTT